MPKARVDAAILRLREDNWLPIIARHLGLTRQATSKWRRVPGDRVLKVAELTGYPPHFLRPDLHHPPAEEIFRRAQAFDRAEQARQQNETEERRKRRRRNNNRQAAHA